MNTFLRHTARRMQDILCTLHIPLQHVSTDCGIFLAFLGGLQAAHPPLPLLAYKVLTLQCRPGARRDASQFLMNFQNMEACGSGKGLRSPVFLCHIGLQSSQVPKASLDSLICEENTVLQVGFLGSLCIDCQV